ncbi:MAG: double-strand break repair helicase AddA [Rhodospirillales bacterium]|nr:double-strand break repair helicase AddA [Rhodospirillales bacterium]
MDPIRESEAAQRDAADPRASVWVAASAGTGKTTVLTRRVLSLLLAGTLPSRILCLTFTRAAAAQMARRVADTLGDWATQDETTLKAELAKVLGHPPDDEQIVRARRLFAEIIEAPGGLNVQTIHGFCQSLLRRFPIEAEIAPHFQIMDERDAAALRAAARDDLLAAAEGGDSGQGELGRALDKVTTYVHESAFADLVRDLYGDRRRLARLLDDHGSVEAAVDATRRFLGLGSDDTSDSILADAAADSAFPKLSLHMAVSRLGASSKKSDQRCAEAIGGWINATHVERIKGFGPYRDALLTTDKKSALLRPRERLVTKEVITAEPAVHTILLSEAERLAKAEHKYRAAVILEVTTALLTVGAALEQAYRRHKERRTFLDFEDLIVATRRLLARPGITPWVLYKLDGGIDHVLIDEAQDTSPDQWRIVEALVKEFFVGKGARDETRTVFAVGDVKQSIFSFQGAEPAEFRTARDAFHRRVDEAQLPWHEVPLTLSYRSTPAVLRSVDAVFQQDAAALGVALDGRAITHAASRHGDAGLVEIWPLVEPEERDPAPAWQPPVDQVKGDVPQARLARLVAQRICAMIDGGERLASRDRAITAGDVMVLVRRRTGFGEELVRALKEFGIPVAGVDRMVLVEQMAVMDLMALGRFLLLPEDDLNLATLLKGPLIGLDEEQLFRLAHGRDGTLWTALGRAAPADRAFQTAHDELSALLGRADFQPPFELFAHVLGAGRGREKLVARLGHDALDPIGEFLELARAYESNHVPSLQGFLAWLDGARVEIKRDLEQSQRDAVRVMTVHGAKGLQAPIVFMPDTAQVPTFRDRLLWLDAATDDRSLLLWPPARELYDPVAEEARRVALERQSAEYRRLLYVAMTRSEDRLYVCGWGARKKLSEDCWYSLIRGGLGTIATEVAAPEIGPSASGAPQNVWRVTSDQTAPARAEARPAFAEDDTQPLEAWASQVAPAEPRPPKPLVPSRPDDEPAVASPLAGDDGWRWKRGRLIHRLLQTLPEIEPSARRASAERFLARPILELDAKLQGEILAETLAVLEDPALAPVFGPGSRAEVPIVGLIGDRALSGQVDRLLVTDDAIMVVDYKTNRDPPATVQESPATYLRQMAAYRAALRLVYPDRPITNVLLWTVGPRSMTIPDDLLDRHLP